MAQRTISPEQLVRRQERAHQRKRQALAIYTPGMSSRQLAAILQISASYARELLYTIHLAKSENR